MKSFFRVLVIAALLVALFYGYKIYRVNTLHPPDVWVDTGDQIICVGCGKVLERNVKSIKVPMRESRHYRIVDKAAVCPSCQQRGVQ